MAIDDEFDVVLCRQDADSEIVFVFNSNIRDTIRWLFPDVEWPKISRYRHVRELWFELAAGLR
jgi:hypothetical protein